MALWSRADRTLHAKIVYYGPALGGKTTNLRALHRLVDPQAHQQLLSLSTADDRTLFFDLLPFELGEIFGYQVALKLYTVPGQVRYETTRQVVLAGADAVVFVADSTPARHEQNVWSLQNLHFNMRAKRLDPARVPILYQFNKQDVADALPPAELARALGLRGEGCSFPAVAVRGAGVLETFVGACRGMLERVVASADERIRRDIDPAELARHVDRAFAPYMSRPTPPGEPSGEPPARSAVPLEERVLLERAVDTGVRLGEQLSQESARAVRLEREVAAFRRLNESLRSVGASFDRQRIVDAALRTAAEILEARLVSLVLGPAGAVPVAERTWGASDEPLLRTDAGHHLVRRLLDADGPCVVDDVSRALPPDQDPAGAALAGACAAVPVERGSRILLVRAAGPEACFRPDDLRFLATVAGQLAVGLEKARLHDELERHRDRLGALISTRTRQLREAYDELRALQGVKDRILGGVSLEMRSPIATIVAAASALREPGARTKDRRLAVEDLSRAAQSLQAHVDELAGLAGMDGAAWPANRMVALTPQEVVEEALRLAGGPQVSWQLATAPLPGALHADLPSLARAVANLVDNAIKFSPAGARVELELRPGRLAAGDALVVSVLDRGRGVPASDRDRIFEPFEQGGASGGSAPQPSGIGLGLHEARAIARRHGGSLEHAPRPGGGSEFRLAIPLLPTGAGDDIQTIAPAHAGEPRGEEGRPWSTS